MIGHNKVNTGSGKELRFFFVGNAAIHRKHNFNPFIHSPMKNIRVKPITVDCPFREKKLAVYP
jgi:hypothetical protein